jgi:PspA-Associated protein
VIVRILEEGQRELDEAAAAKLTQLDEKLGAAVDGGDDEAFAEALAAVLDHVRRHGKALPDDYLGPSDVALPHAGATREEVRELLRSEGVITG